MNALLEQELEKSAIETSETATEKEKQLARRDRVHSAYEATQAKRDTKTTGKEPKQQVDLEIVMDSEADESDDEADDHAESEASSPTVFRPIPLTFRGRESEACLQIALSVDELTLPVCTANCVVFVDVSSLLRQVRPSVSRCPSPRASTPRSACLCVRLC